VFHVAQLKWNSWKEVAVDSKIPSWTVSASCATSASRLGGCSSDCCRSWASLAGSILCSFIYISLLIDRTVDSFHWRTLADWYCCRSRGQRNSQQPCLRIRPKLFWNTRFLKVKYSCIAYHLAHPTFVRTWICNRLSPSRILKYETHFIIFFCNHWHR